jgi:hypothetical protein
VLVGGAENPLANAIGEHQQITVRVLDEDLALTRFAVACSSPDFTWTEIDWPILANEMSAERPTAGNPSFGIGRRAMT